jgi:hypothetical protein
MDYPEFRATPKEDRSLPDSSRRSRHQSFDRNHSFHDSEITTVLAIPDMNKELCAFGGNLAYERLKGLSPTRCALSLDISRFF